MQLVSCIMPTYNRSGFVPNAIGYFLREDLSAAELIIIDDGTDPVQTLIPEDPRLRYVRLSERRPLGAKRNLACEIARGEIIAHWDDDDWYAPDRLSRQAALLTESGASLCGLDTVLFYDLRSGEAWRYVYPPHERPWLAGNSLMYRRTFWSAHHFPEIDVGEDTLFVWSAQPQDLVRLPDPRIHVGIVHGGNVSPKQIGGPWWQAYPVEDIRKLLGDDWYRYAQDAAPPDSGCSSAFARAVGIAAEKPLAPGPDDGVPERMMSMITLAQEADLALPEYVAFNQAQSLPRMRRWELPFAVFESRLSNSMAVLDCTINPVTLPERLAALYKHVLYRHWNPIQSGEFRLPFGVPDGAFDRVMCINTLEHLLGRQRELMVADMARKLKPGGWLILTCDFYFDSFWQDSAFLQSGVMRADGEEVFNGFN
jgi:hypothetical protein